MKGTDETDERKDIEKPADPRLGLGGRVRARACGRALTGSVSGVSVALTRCCHTIAHTGGPGHK